MGIFILKNSSVPAVTRIGMAESRAGKFLWFLILVTLLFTCAFHVIKFMEKYFTYPVVISLKEERMEILEFPSVTLCNLNRMKSKYMKCLQYNVSDEPQCDTALNIRDVGPDNLYYNPMYAYKGPRLVISKEKIHPNKNATEEQRFLYSYFQTPEHIRMQMSHQVDLIKKCTFSGHLCEMDTQIRYFFDNRYGFCMTFNVPEGKKKVILKTNQTGSEGGLEMTLDFNPIAYLRETHSVGGRIVIHHSEEMPDFEEQGFNISPGLQTSITLKQTIMKRLPHPYKDTCFNYSKGKETAPRTQRECQKLCFQQYNFKTCRCIDPNMIPLKNFPACDLWNDQQLKCLRRVSERIKDRSCHCPRACHSISYNGHLSHAKYPPLNQVGWEPDYVEIKKNFRYPPKSRSRLGKVNVFYSTLNRKTFKQSPAFQDSEVLGNFGGAFGLWLGISIFLIFELLEIATTFGKLSFMEFKKLFK